VGLVFRGVSSPFCAPRMRCDQRDGLSCATPNARVPQRGVLARNSLVLAPDMFSNPIAVMLYVELALFAGGLVCLVVGRMREDIRARGVAKQGAVPSPEAGLALSRLG
jgi:hypothetical protein